MVKRIAVIGAGPAGLCALKNLTSRPLDFEVVAFERYARVGGMWVYTDRVGTDVDGLPVHSSMYKKLRANFPKYLMTFPGFPFPNPRPSFPDREEVLAYVEAYADHYKLHKFIKTVVTRVTPVTPGSRDTEWEVTYRHVTERDSSITERFHCVMVCNGHCSVPNIPDIAGRDRFQGLVMHAHDYRVEDDFRGISVLLVGGGATVADLTPTISVVAKKLLISHDWEKAAISFQIPEGVTRKPPVQTLTEDGVVFVDGQQESVDVVLYCTGYKYSFPFLTKDCGVQLKDNDTRVTPLYKHMIHTTHPTLMFIGIPEFIILFPLVELQTRLAMKVLDGSVVLPDKEEMDRKEEEDLRKRLQAGSKAKNFHKMHVFQFEYFDALSELGKLPKLSEGIRQLFMHHMKTIVADTLTYKSNEYEISDESFKVFDKVWKR